MEINQDFIKSKLNYDPETGIFTWKRKKVSNTAGYLQKDGYIRFNFNNKHFRAHTLAWLYMYGEYPSQHIDHINGNPSDNRISNLRLCTRSQNMHNRKVNKTNKLGIKGVCWNKRIKKFHVQISLNGKVNHIGYFEDLELAELVAIESRIKFHKEFARI